MIRIQPGREGEEGSRAGNGGRKEGGGRGRGGGGVQAGDWEERTVYPVLTQDPQVRSLGLFKV